MQTVNAKATENIIHEHDNDEYANGWQCRPSPLQTDLTSRFAELISLTSSDSEYMQGSKAQAQWQNPDPDEPGQGEITEDTSALRTKHGRQSDGDFSKAAAGQGSMQLQSADRAQRCAKRLQLRVSTRALGLSSKATLKYESSAKSTLKALQNRLQRLQPAASSACCELAKTTAADDLMPTFNRLSPVVLP